MSDADALPLSVPAHQCFDHTGANFRKHDEPRASAAHLGDRRWRGLRGKRSFPLSPTMPRSGLDRGGSVPRVARSVIPRRSLARTMGRSGPP